MMRGLAFLTGGTGFVGSAVARDLLNAGFSVRALARAESSTKNLDGLPLEIVRGDMRDAAAMAQAIDGARYVFHVAADYRLWTPNPGEMRTANLEGTRAVMQAALAARVERVVYTSSVATLKLSPDGTPADETASLKETETIGAYKQSKVAAERLVDDLVARHALPAVIVNPSTPIGPRDIKPTPTGRLVVEAASGRVPAFVDTGLNLVHVDDVAAGHRLALEKGRIGERYILGGENVELSGILARIAHLVGRKPPTARLPRRALFPLAYGAEAVARITKKEPFITVDGLKMAKYKMFFTSAKAERELGYRGRPIDDALADAISWFKAEGYIG